MAEDASSSAPSPIILDARTELLKLSDESWRYSDTAKSQKFATPSDLKVDVKIKVGDELIPSNKAALRESSVYFESLLSKHGAEQEVVEVVGVDVKHLQLALEYLHHGHVTLGRAAAEDCLAAALALKIEWLQRACHNYVVFSTPPENCDLVVGLADRLSLPLLRKDVFAFLGLNLLPLHDNGKLVTLPEAILTELLSGAYYVEAPEELVLQVIVEWVNGSFEERKDTLSKLIALIRFNLMNPEELENIPPAILDIDGIRERVDAAKALWSDLYGICVADQSLLEPRGAVEAVIALSTHAADTVQYTRPDDSFLFREQFGCSIAGVLLDHAGTAGLGNFIFVAGGYDMGYDVSDRVHRYDPRFRNWLPVASLKQKRVNFAMFTSATNVFVIGGSTREGKAGDTGEESADAEEETVVADPGEGETPLKSCEKYDPKTNSWALMADLPHGCFDLAGCCLGAGIYVSGGITDNPSDPVPVNRVYNLEPGAQEWVEKAPMLWRRQGHSMQAVSNRIYVVGGSTTVLDDASTSHGMQRCLKNECYDLQTNQWTEISSTPTSFGRLYKDVAVYGNVIYVLGGNNCSRYLHEYNVVEDKWRGGKFCGDNLIKLLLLKAAVPFAAPSDVASPNEAASLNDPASPNDAASPNDVAAQ